MPYTHPLLFFDSCASNIGDRLMVDTMRKLPSVGRKGIPPNKVTLCLRKVPDNFVPRKAIERVQAKQNVADLLAAFVGDYPAATDATAEAALRATLIAQIAAETMLEMRKISKLVVGTAQSAARKNEQVDVLLTKPSFL